MSMLSRQSLSLSRCLVALLGILASTAAWAHHPMGGETPATYLQGMLSGLAHPVIGLEHLAFITAVGVMLGLGVLRRAIAPALLIGAAVGGTTLNWLGTSVPMVELVVLLSVLGAAAVIWFEPAWRDLATGMAIPAAFCHGQAYGEAIIGAEPTPVGAYLLGFTIVQMALAGVAFGVTRWALTRPAESTRQFRRSASVAVGSLGVLSVVVAPLI